MSDRAVVLGCPIDRLDMAATVARCSTLIEAGGPAQHVAVNAAKLVAMHDDPRLRAIVHGCDVVSADGQSVVWAGRLLGQDLPERVAGIDLMRQLIELAEARGYRVFLLGAREEVVRRAADVLRERYPRLVIAGHHHGYIRNDDARVASQIRDARPHILFIGMSSPKKEYWADAHIEKMGIPLVIGVGGTFDVVAGFKRRAPRWMQRAGLEWLFRLAQEPVRLAPRYARTNVAFALLVAHSWWRGRLSKLSQNFKQT